MKRVICTGGRDYWDDGTVRQVLKCLNIDEVEIVHGAYPTGLDSVVDRVARELGFHVAPYEADWRTYDKAAGPKRNSEMVDDGAYMCIAFPGGKGTKDCAWKAQMAGIPTLKVQ